MYNWCKGGKSKKDLQFANSECDIEEGEITILTPENYWCVKVTFPHPKADKQKYFKDVIACKKYILKLVTDENTDKWYTIHLHSPGNQSVLSVSSSCLWTTPKFSIEDVKFLLGVE